MQAAPTATRDHWDRIYATKTDLDVSWFEATPTLSLQMLHAAGVTSDSCVIDIGGGNSRLVDALFAEGLQCLAVLDVSSVAIDNARARLGPAADTVRWIAADVTGEWSVAPVDVWHDRAVFHFLTTADARGAYLQHLNATVRPGGHVVLATFALDGPEKCSGLPVVRYSPETLGAELGIAYQLVESQLHTHVTPRGGSQAFQYSLWRRVPTAK